MDFSSSKLYGIKNKKYLSDLLKIDIKELKEVDKYFFTEPFLKVTNGKNRTLYNPHKKYKYILSRINFHLQKIAPPSYVFGGIKKRDYIMNAAMHKNNAYFLLLDITNFFPTTKDKYVYKFFRYKLNMAEDIAKICTLLTTEPSNGSNYRHLPQGYPTSPYLSFLSYFDMYNGLNNLAEKNSLSFSCYYDDFTFSSPKYINKKMKNDVIELIQKYELNVNPKKTRLLKNQNGVKLTGTILIDDKLKAPNKLQQKMFQYFKELITIYEKNPQDKRLIKLCNIIQGCLTAIKAVEKDREFPVIKDKIKEVRIVSKYPKV